jgi:cell division protein FtsI/penicillin-binding protein 2/cell division protein FtsW (lipid II flippase)
VLTVERGGPDRPERVRGVGRRRRRNFGSRTFDLLAVFAVVVLGGLGVLNLYEVGGEGLAIHQLLTAAAGLVLLAVLWRSRIRLLNVLGWICYAVGIMFLIAVLVMGVEANGAARWIALGSFTFQPSELAKLGMLLVLAEVLGSSLPLWRRFSSALVLALVPIALTALEPDLSTATLLTVLAVAMLILGRIPARLLLPLFGGAIVVAPLAIGLLRPYQVERLSAFITGSQSPSGSGWAVLQAHIALASGGLLGRAGDPLHGLYADYLPEGETDLALASLAESWGLIAGITAVVAGLVLVWRLASASRVPRTLHGCLVGGGLAVLLGAEIVVSVGGNLGLLPLAGVPFPLLSYGGTAVVVHLAAIGIVLSARRDGARRRLWAAPRWRNPRPRLVRLAALGVTAALVAFTAYGWHMQVAQGDSLRLAGQDQMTRCIRLPAPRGVVTDRHGTPLATNGDTGKIVAVTALLRRNPGDVTRLAGLIGQSDEQVNSVLSAAPAADLTVQVAEVPGEAARAVAAANLSGVIVTPGLRRIYPTGALLGPVLGFAGVATPAELQRWPDLPLGEIVGRAGVEQQYDSILRGVNGQQCVYVNPAGAPVATAARREPVPGANLRLSIDLGLQQKLTSDLAASLPGPQGKRASIGGAVAMDPRNGQVLAIASLPSHDNNIYGPPVDSAALQRAQQAPGQATIEHVTQAAVPPGSTFKLVVASADMVHPVFPPDVVVPTGGSFTLAGHTFNNWSVLGPQNLPQAIAWSNDVYFYKLAWALGPDAMIDTARALGVGRPTGIDLPGESAGYLGTPDTVGEMGATWYGGSTVILGIGQGYIQVTPLQNARWTAGVATGSLVTPRLGLATGTDSSAYTALPAPATARLPFADSLGPVRAGMRAAVTGGTAADLRALPVPAGAKTGTAEDLSSPGALDHWMTAAAPMDNPSIVMTALVQGPDKVTASPVVAKSMQYYFAHEQEILGTAPMQGR